MKNIYKGLILKDLLNLKGYKFTIIVFIVIFTLVGISQENYFSFLPLMLIMGLGLFGISTFSYDELAKSDKYILTMPISKKDIIISKYILVMMFNIVGAVLGIIVTYIVQYVLMGQMANIIELISFCIGGIFAITLVQSVQIPIILKKGAIKGRVYLFAIFGVIALLVTGIVFLISLMNIPLSLEFENISPIYGLVTLIFLTVIEYYISYRISYKIYTKKEII